MRIQQSPSAGLINSKSVRLSESFIWTIDKQLFFYVNSTLTLYKVRIWLASMMKREIRLIDDTTLNEYLDTLDRWSVSALSLSYRYYHSMRSDDMKAKIPLKACFTCTKRYADFLHPFARGAELTHSPFRLSLWLELSP